MQEDTPPLEAQSRFYDDWNTRHRSGGFEEIPVALRRRAQRLLLELDALLTGGPKSPRILELGCGTGWLSEQLVKRGEVLGIDLSPQAIAIAKSRGCGAEFVAGDFLTYDFGGSNFDVGVCVETLFYVQDQRACVERFASLLKPRAPIGVTTINSFVYERMASVPEPSPGQIRRWLGRKELVALLELRFEILSVHTIHPGGDQGVLRLVNSYRLNAAAGRLVGPDRIRRVKEAAGLGEGILVMGRKRA